METSTLADAWADRFGLARVPLFGNDDPAEDGIHDVLLDGGLGSFTLSARSASPPSDRVRDWSWSCNVPHHVAATEDDIFVVRWDDPTIRKVPKARVEHNMATFYRALVSDRVRSSWSVVDHMLWVFRRVRSVLSERGVPDQNSMGTFLAVIEQAMASTMGPDHRTGPLADIPMDAVNALVKDVRTPANHILFERRFLPSLAVRHAGSEIFQEAHFELLHAGEREMLGYIGPATSSAVTRGGAHFTPPALARSLVEQTLAQLKDLPKRKHLTIADPACGSAAFLHEALRTLARLGFEGRVELVGRDISEPAVAMANFVLAHAKSDWEPRGGCTINVTCGDSLAEPIRGADVVLMNPPFVSWMGQTKEQRATVREVLGRQGRGDLSMAFISGALSTLREGGALGALMPGSLLALKGAEEWRRSLVDDCRLGLVASLADFRLFAYAHVQAAMIVLSRPQRNETQREDVTVLVADNDRSATGDALRMLRRGANSGEPGVRIFPLKHEHFRQSPVWRLTPPDLRRAIDRYVESGNTALVREAFRVHQGVRTGDNRAFLLSEEAYQRLPVREREWFRAAITNEAFERGTVRATRHLFYPYRDGKLAIQSLEELHRLVPQYCRMQLAPREERLRQRSRVQAGQWWCLAEPRHTWASSSRPRIVSKGFGPAGSFAMDANAEFVVVQGNAWFLKRDALGGTQEERGVLETYVRIFNTQAFARLLSVYCAHLDGGHFELSPRFVGEIPIPNIQALAGVSNDLVGVSPGEFERMVEELYGDILSYL